MVAGAISVVQILPELNAGGVERGTVEMAGYLVSHGHQSLVISQGGSMVEQLLLNGSRHLRMPYIGEKTPRCLSHVWSLRKLFIQGSIDIVHLRSRLPAWVAYLAWKSIPERRRPSLVTTFHGFYSVNPYSAVMTKGQRVIAISKAISDHIEQVYRTPASKIEIIHRGVDVEQFHPDMVDSDRVQRIRQTWGLREEKAPLIVLPGRITFLKGHDVFIEALARIRGKAWRAVCVGAADPTSHYYKKLMDQVRRLKLTDVVKFVDHEVDMPAVYAAADIVVSATSAKAEAFGRVSIEAQAMARPIVASAHGGTLETVEHGHTGLLFKPGDPESLSGALSELLSNPDLRRRYGKNGFIHAHTKFTKEQMCRRTLLLYHNLLA